MTAQEQAFNTPSKSFFSTMLDNYADIHDRMDAAVGKVVHKVFDAARGKEAKEYSFEENATFGRAFDKNVAAGLLLFAPVGGGLGAMEFTRASLVQAASSTFVEYSASRVWGRTNCNRCGIYCRFECL